MIQPPYADRADAGRTLARLLLEKRLPSPTVVAIPRGGVPVGVEIALGLGAPLHLILLRKLFIPHEPEAGFGAMAPDGSVFVDEDWVKTIGLTPEQVRSVITEVRDELDRRRKVYHSVSVEHVRDRDVILTDDGIAAGYSMSVAAKYLRALGPRSLCVAVPCAPESSLPRVRPHADEIICPHVTREMPFSVASFYHHWHDLSDHEVHTFLMRLP